MSLPYYILKLQNLDLVFQIESNEIMQSTTAFTCIFILQSDDNPNNMNLLQAMLNACKLENGNSDIHIVSNFLSAQIPKGYTKVLVFGDDLSEFCPNLEKTYYQPLKIGKIDLVVSHSLSKLGIEKNLKGELWAALQKVFLQ